MLWWNLIRRPSAAWQDLLDRWDEEQAGAVAVHALCISVLAGSVPLLFIGETRTLALAVAFIAILAAPLLAEWLVVLSAWAMTAVTSIVLRLFGKNWELGEEEIKKILLTQPYVLILSSVRWALQSVFSVLVIILRLQALRAGASEEAALEIMPPLLPFWTAADTALLLLLVLLDTSRLRAVLQLGRGHAFLAALAPRAALWLMGAM